MAERKFNSLATDTSSTAAKAGEHAAVRQYQGNIIYEKEKERQAAKEEQISSGPMCISSDVEFYSVNELCEKTGWSIKAVRRMFGMPDFPYMEFGKEKVVEAHALIEYCSVRRDRNHIEKMGREVM